MDLYRLRTPRPPDCWDDLREVLHVAAALVPRALPDDEHSLWDLGQAARARAGRLLPDRLADVHKIRNELISDAEDEPLSGDVEIDETSVRGRYRGPKMTRTQAAQWREAQPSVLGMVERGGRVRLGIIASRRGPALSKEVRAHVNPASLIITDDWQAYKPLRREYLGHRIINHSAGQYVNGDIHTNTIEGFFGNLKTGMRGAYKHVSPRWLQSYLDEYAWRYNNRNGGRAMFHTLLDRAAR